MPQLLPLNEAHFFRPEVDEKTKKLFSLFVDLTKVASENGRNVLAFGGFAVDLAVGEIMRPHDDLDLSVFNEDFGWFREEYDFKKRQQKKASQRHKEEIDYVALEKKFPDIQEQIKKFH